MKGLNDDEVCNFIELTRNKVNFNQIRHFCKLSL